MCDEEAEQWINGNNAWIRRFKWFSPNIEWIKSRVQDGKFNNSNSCLSRYSRLLQFEWNGLKHDFQSINEIQFDRRKNPTIKFIREIQ